MDHEESRIERLRRLVEEAYADNPTGCGGSFGEILCWEIHTNGQTFVWLAEKWGMSLPTIGELIWDHCKRLEKGPVIRTDKEAPEEYERIEALKTVAVPGGFGLDGFRTIITMQPTTAGSLIEPRPITTSGPMVEPKPIGTAGEVPSHFENPCGD